MKTDTRRYVREWLNGVSSAYRFARHLVSGNGNKSELSGRDLYDFVSRDVITGIFAFIDRLDLDLIRVKPDHDLDAIMGTREARDQLFIYLREQILPKYGVKTRLDGTFFNEQTRIANCIEHVYGLILETNKPTEVR